MWPGKQNLEAQIGQMMLRREAVAGIARVEIIARRGWGSNEGGGGGPGRLREIGAVWSLTHNTKT